MPSIELVYTFCFLCLGTWIKFVLLNVVSTGFRWASASFYYGKKNDFLAENLFCPLYVAYLKLTRV